MYRYRPELVFGQPTKARAVLYALTHAVRLLSDEQVGRLWFPNSKRPQAHARALLQRLATKGLVRLLTAMVHPELQLRNPAFEWRPGDLSPPFGRLAFHLKARWRDAPQRTVVARATTHARRMLGGFIGGRPIRSHEVSHDLGLATVYFRLLETTPELKGLWRHEDELWQAGAHRRGQPIPDAVLLKTPQVAIEFGGEYGAQKLALVHRHFESGPYELW